MDGPLRLRPGGVPNRVDDVSCSINDLIADEQSWASHGRFMNHVNNVVRDLRADGMIDGREGGAITTPQDRRKGRFASPVLAAGGPTHAHQESS